MLKIRTYNAISPIGLDRFSTEIYSISDHTDSADAIMLRSHKLAESEIGSQVLAVGRAGAGTNNVPVAYCTEHGLPVFNAPGANANAVKELVLTGMLLSCRGIINGISYANSLDSIDTNSVMAKTLEAEKKRFKGQEIKGKTLGVIGLGAIGSLVADMAISMGMKVIGYDPALSVEAAWRLSSDIEKIDNLNSLFAKSDFVSLHLPVLDSTRNLINRDVLSSAKKGCRLLNFAREEIVHEDSIVEALDKKQLDRYITDFPTKALINRQDVIAMPHIGASTKEAEDNCAIMVADQLMDFLENGNIVNSVNFPTTILEREVGTHRICIANHNVPKILSSVLSLLADQNINVVDMLNKSRNNIAYNLIDLSLQPNAELLDQLSSLEGVVQVRVIEP